MTSSLLEQQDEKPKVMQAKQHGAEHFAGGQKVSQIGAGEFPTGEAIDFLVQGGIILAKKLVA